MTKTLRNIIQPVIMAALDLKDRVDRGEPVNMENEQARLRALLQSDIEAKRLVEYGGDGMNYLGARYALVAWIDELFILYTSLGDQWRKRSMEVDVYGGTANRAGRFWEQAEMAQKGKSASLDAIEVYFLCVMLGFRGRLLNDPAKLKAWVDAVGAQVSSAQEWSVPNDLGVTTNVAPLLGRDLFRRRLLARGGLVALLLLAIIIIIQSQSH
jgi:type VI secretion system protein ImpK